MILHFVQDDRSRLTPSTDCRMTAPGSVADLLVLDRDIFSMEPSGIKDVCPLVTLVGGEVAYDPEGLFK